MWFWDVLLWAAGQSRTVATGLATEADTALALASDQPIGLAEEVDQALALRAAHVLTLGLATETDTALGATALRTLGFPTETDSALHLAMPIGMPIETDTALSLRPVRIKSIGLAEETDSVLALTLLDGQVEPISFPTETDAALSVVQRILALADESDEALSVLEILTGYWPEDLKPRDIGIYPCASPIGGGVSVKGIEPTIDSGNGYWRIEYGGIPVNTRDRILLWRAIEAYCEGRGRSIIIRIYDGKRAPWPGDPGGPLAAVADAAVAEDATSIAIDATGLAALQVGMGFSAGQNYYRIKAITSTVGNVYTCTIFPPTREAIADGASLEFGQPIMRVKLQDDDGMRLTLAHHRFGEGNVTFIEDMP